MRGRNVEQSKNNQSIFTIFFMIETIVSITMLFIVMSETGVFLHFGDVSVQVANSLQDFNDFIEHLSSIAEEIKENYGEALRRD